MDTLIIAAKLENLEKMFAFIREAAARQGFNPKDVNQIQLACEEALVNVINYAYPGKEGDLKIACANKKDFLEIEISDSGLSFNPLLLPEPDINLPIDERKIGGLGIYMMRKIMDEVRYRREDDRNILTLVKFQKEEK